ncbi:hypothetical protein DWU98_20505 [Dyella monticola]|uniref:Autotransporter domain-containing protein n=1 Tax=Dyella monticola TaxID=1927958 RepID=A0A370WS09_9GAMM|nr:autotransporter-associated beta strand repeat-containing protein [Dyella monticola]RDS78904.1 hypothetical protein DWU98_20505 [Dyella monticola]
MNRIYRLVFNRALGVMQVASELASAPKGGVVEGEAAARPALKSRALALAVSLVLASIAAPAMAQTCTASATVLCGTVGGDGGAGNISGTAGTAGSGAVASGAYANAGGAGGTASGAGSAGQGINGSAGGGGSVGTGRNDGRAGGAGAGGNATTQGVGGGGGGGGGFNSYATGGGGGGGGGVGQSVLVGASFTNPGSVVGGHGGKGGNGGYNSKYKGQNYSSAYAGGGGGGGAGIYAATESKLTNASGASITGGNGGIGGSGFRGANGGGGGAGVTGSGFYLSSAGTITGGSGGNGGSWVTDGGYGGSGGAGGAGVSGSVLNVVNSGTITGGAGGAGASDLVGGGSGGAGGAGVAMSGAASSLSNSGSITGGAGGAGAATTELGGQLSGRGGAGGTGLVMSGSYAFLTNQGSITGGAGGTSSGSGGSVGAGGVGVAISGNNVTLADSGSISGGLNGAGASRNYAVDITGRDDVLTLVSGYSFSGSVYAQPGNSNTLDLDGNVNATFDVSSIVGGFDFYEKQGASTWTLTGSTSAVTPWVLFSGTLAISSDASLGASSGIATLDGGTLEMTASTSSSRQVALIGSSTVLTDAGVTWVENGDIIGSGALDKSGSGTLVLTGTNAYTGGTVINAGTLQIGNGGATGAILGNVTDNGVLSFDGTGTAPFASVIAGSGVVQQIGTGTTDLIGDNTYSGTTTISGGTLELSGSASIARSASVIDNATFDISNTTSGALITSLSGTGTVNLGTQTLTLTQASGSFSGAINGGGGLTLEAGTETLGGNNSYNGMTAINGGTLMLSGAGSIAHSSDVVDSGTFDISNTSGASITSLAGNGTVNLGAQTLTLTDANDTFSGSISGTGGLTLDAGNETLTGADTYSGTTTVNGGSLSVTSGGSMANIATLIDNGMVVVDGTGSNITATLGAGGTPVMIGDNGNGTLIVSNSGAVVSNGQLNVGQNAGDQGSVTVTSGGQLMSNTFINIGQLGTGSLIVSAGGGVTASGFFSLGDGGGSSGTVLVTGSGSSLNAPNIAVGNHGGTGTLTVASGGSVTATSFVIAADAGSAGTVNIGAAAGQPAAAAGTLNTNAVSFGNGTGTLVFNLTNASYVFAPTISGNGVVDVLAGTTVFTAVNTYTGTTTISGGTLELSGSGSIADSASVIDNATFDISNVSGGTSIKSLSGYGVVNLGTRSLTLTQASGLLVGWIEGSGSLTLNSGTEMLAGSNTYTGNTTINGGTLSLSGGGHIDDTATVIDNGTLLLQGQSSITAADGGTPFLIGDGGTGTLTASSGARVASNGEFEIGWNAGDVGSVTIASGSSLSATDSINVGKYGTGTLTVSGGGTVSAGGYLSIADQAGSNGTVVVTGSGSSASATSVVAVGNHAGTGTLTVADGGSVSAPTVEIAAAAGSTGTLNIGAAAGEAAAAAGTLNTSNVVFGNGAGALVFNHTDTGYVFAPTLSGNGTVDVLAGTTLFTADNSYTGTTTISGGSLQLGNGGSSGWITTDVTNNSALVFDRSDNVAFTNAISGSGSVTQNGSGTLALDNVNSYTGGTTVNNGTLLIGDSANPGAQVAGDVVVNSGATLGGVGSIGGNVTVVGGAHLAPGANGSFGTLSIGGNLSVAQGAVLDYGFSAPGNGYSTPGTGDQVNVGGNLTLNGATLNVNGDASFGQGLYTLFQYNGVLTETNGGITLGTVPAGDTLSLQTLANQINLVNTGGTALNMWNGNGQASATQMGGGSGTWSATSSNWTDANGDVSAAMVPQPGFAVFGGTAGTVTIDNSAGAVAATGMQFAVNGYVMSGDTLTLVTDGSGNAPAIRVGDGTSNGASYTAEIDNVLAGSAGINKTDNGTLILGGTNTYTGGTTISGGTLQIGNGGSSGSVLGDVVDNANLAFAHTDAVTFDGAISGTGNLVQLGTGTLTLTNTETYSGTTTISAGVLALSSTGSIAASSSVIDNATFDVSAAGATINSLSGSGNVNLGGQMLTLTQAADTFGGVINGNGGCLALNAGTEVLTGANTYTGSTTINGGTLQLGNGGTSGSVVTDVLDNGTLAFDRSDTNAVFGNVISGSGSVVQNGTGTLTLSNSNTYSGGTVINAGTLSGTTSSFGNGAITDDASLVLSQSSDGTLTNAISGSGSLSVNGSGTITFSGSNSYSGGTSITAGTLVGDSNSLQGDIVDNASLSFQQTANGSYVGALSGSGTLTSSGAAVLSLTGNSSAFAGATQITGGTLQVDGALGGNVDAAAGTTLAGQGTLGGNVTIEGGATLAPGDANGGAAIGTLTVGGNLSMLQGSVYTMDVGAAGAALGTVGSSDSVTVNGNLALNGVTLNVNDTGNMGPGIYTLFNYSGTLSETSGGIALGAIPTGDVLTIENLTGDHQINLVNTTGLTINMWNGNGAASSTQMGGGSGTWSATSQNFSNAGGNLSAPLSPQPGFAVFGGTAGTVAVSDSAGNVSALGMQFASNGYVMNGDTLTLVANAGAAPIIRVGDGTTQGASYVAEIDNVLAGSAGIDKTDNGTLILAGANTYTGGTTISGGTLQIGNGGNSGSILGNVANSGSLAFDRSDAMNFAGVVSGAGNVVQMGHGTLTLSAANTYTGNTEIDAGTLALSAQGSIADASHVIDNAVFDISQTSGASIRSLSGNGSVILGAQTLTLSAASDTFSGVIAGSGGVTLSGGTQVFAGANTYSGATTITSGTLQLGNGGTGGSLAGNVVDNGKLAFDRSDDIVFAGAISGSGSVQQLSSGNLTLSGVNTYTGGTSIEQGTLALNNASAIGSGTLAMAAGTTLHATGGFTLANAITLSGDPDVDVDAGLTTTLAGVISNGTQAGDLVKTGAGTLVLSGADTYTGSTDVAAGALEVTGSLVSHVTVGSGAALIGTGSIGGLNVVSGGVVSPGVAGIGTLQVNGNVSLAAGSIYQLDASDTGSSDLIRASGTATLGGGSVVSTEAGSNWNPSTRYTILTAASISGTFGGVSSNFAFLTPTLSYDASNVTMTLTRNTVAFGSVGTTANQINTGNAVANSASSAVYSAVLTLAASPARAAFDDLSGGSLASTRTAILDDSHFVRDAISTHLQQVQGAGQLVQNDADGSVWASTWGHGGDHDSDGNAAAVRATGSGVLVGADRNLDAWRIGAVAGSGELSDSNINGGGDAHSIDKVFGLYTGLSLDAWQLQGGMAHSWYDTQSHRQIGITGIQGSTDANSSNGLTQAYLDGGYQFTFAQGSLTPYVDVARAWIHQGAMDEVGDAAALNVQASDSSVNYGTAGLRGIYEPSQGLQLHATVGYQQAWGDLRSTDQQSFAGGGNATFVVDGVPVAKSAGVVDLGMRFAINSKVSVEASYHGQFAGSAKDEGARMSVNVNF